MASYREQSTLSIVVPCYNEERTLAACIERVLWIQNDSLRLEILIIDDCSTDQSLTIAQFLSESFPEIKVISHSRNLGKGAALQTGFQHATGDFVAIQDADLEYDPNDLRRLLEPLLLGQADVVFGSRFLSHGTHRVLYFWHSLANKVLTFLSNMFSDLNLTDMETCYKVFRREIIQSIQIEESRFGVEPEIVAKVAQLRPRIYEMGISYYGRTYEEGKKIGFRDGLRALYCIFHYNVPTAPAPIQFLIYLFIGGLSAVFNLGAFLGLLSAGLHVGASALGAYGAAAMVNYWLCIMILFRHKARWSSVTELAIYAALVAAGGLLDVWTTQTLIMTGNAPWLAKTTASIACLIFNFIGRRHLVFPERRPTDWKPQLAETVFPPILTRVPPPAAGRSHAEGPDHGERAHPKV
jgi:dolichol-phosphate mannosyltransferase